MIELKGKYGFAKIFTNNVEKGALDQIKDVLNEPWSKDVKIRVMPDVHHGYGVPIGYTQTIKDTIIPNFVGVDIGCGMLVSKISDNPNYHIDFKRLDDFIRREIPFGFNVHRKNQELDLNIHDLIAEVNIDRAYKSVGTLGGGNHFIEINRSDKGIYLVIHSGSRHLGVQVCDYWSKKIDSSTNYLKDENFQGYLHDMKITQKFASINRKRMRDRIFQFMDFRIIDEFETIHNYIDLENMILRKGAISAKKDEIVLIPINMKDGSIIARGLGNSDWNNSAPHGAGRVMSRTQAKKNISLEKFKNVMEDIWTTSVSRKTLDEAPFVYKPMKEIIKNTKDTIEILEYLKVLYNFKA